MLGIAPAGRAAAQETRPAAIDADPLISLNFPENTELKVLVDYVAQRLGINIAYDEQINGKKVTLRAPAAIPKSSLLPLLEGTLRMKGLTLINADQPGWKRIVPATDLLQVAPRALPAPRSADDAPNLEPSGGVLTQVFALKHSDTKRVEQAIKPFLTQPGASTLSLPEQGLIVVTDYGSNMERIAGLIGLMDQPRGDVVFEFVRIENVEATQMAALVTQLLASKRKAMGAADALEGLELSADSRTNDLVVVGTKSRVDEAVRLARSRDVPLEVETRVYQFRAASPERVDRLVKELIGPIESKRAYRSAIDREAGLLVVTAPRGVHARLVALQSEMDRPVSQAQSRVRIYKLENATAAEVLNTIRALEGGTGFEGVAVEGVGGRAGDEGRRRPEAGEPQGPNAPPPPAGEVPPPPPVYESDPLTGIVRSPDGAPQALSLQAVHGAQATVTADTNTNSIIVVADPQVQAVYEQLIRMLDRRRPQVLVEIILVTIDTTRNFNLGVEITGRGTAGPARFLNFSSFGLNDLDPDTGQIALTPGLGFTGAVLTADVADIVVQALSANSRARVSSAPRLLVNDNASGTLTSVAEAPFSSLNASDTVATTSFAGFVSAGTTISVTPHISEGDHLQLEYAVALNNFTGQSTASGGAVLPPPRQTNSINSKVTIPDGHTIVVGGLKRKNMSRSKSGIPILGDIPVLEYLFSARTEEESEQTLFAFIKPVILRDDQFKDLKFLSDRDAQKADLGKPFPSSVPMTVR